MDLDRLIEEAQSAGTLDSSGRFTLDLERAWEKLGRHSLQRPSEFVLNLVRAAVGSGASYLRCEEQAGKLSCEFPGEVPGLAHLFDRPFAEGEVWLKELAQGIFLGLSSGFVSRAVLSSGTERLEVWLEGSRPHSEVSPRPGTGPTTLLLTCRRRWLGPSTGSVVHRRCGLAPLQLSWNGLTVTGEIPIQGLLGWRRIRSTRRLPGVGLPFDREGPTVTTDQPGEAVVGLARSGGLTVIVCNGVADQTVDELFPGARIWVSAPAVWHGLTGTVSLQEPIFQLAARVALELAREHQDELTPEQLLMLVVSCDEAVPAGLRALSDWPEAHPLRPQLLLAVLCALLRRHEFAEADKLVLPLQQCLLKAPSFLQRLRRKGRPLYLYELCLNLDVLAEECPREAMLWLERVAAWTARRGEAILRRGLADLALNFQRHQLAERIALELLGLRFNPPPAPKVAWPPRPRPELTGHRAMGMAFTPGNLEDLILLMRSQSPHGRTRRSEELVSVAPPELRAAACEQAADSYRWAAQRYNDQALFELMRDEDRFQWRGQYLKRADELYAEALKAGGDPVRLGRSRARAAALPIEGLAKAVRLVPHHRQRYRAACERETERFLALRFDDPEVRLLEAEVRSERGELARASVLLDTCRGVVADVNRAIVERLSGREAELDLSGLVALPARASNDMGDFMVLLLASRDMAPVPEGLAGRLIRLAELCDRPQRLKLLRCALAVQFRFLGRDVLNRYRLPSAALWLMNF